MEKSTAVRKTGIWRIKTTVMEVRVFLNELLREMELPVFMLEGWKEKQPGKVYYDTLEKTNFLFV